MRSQAPLPGTKHPHSKTVGPTCTSTLSLSLSPSPRPHPGLTPSLSPGPPRVEDWTTLPAVLVLRPAPGPVLHSAARGSFSEVNQGPSASSQSSPWRLE